ncbi:MAG: phosphoglycerate dehydrogenase [Thermoanaerobaculia bacterium]
MPRVLISTSSFAAVCRDPLDELEAAGFDCLLNPHGRVLTTEETRELLNDMDGLIAGTETLSREVLAGAQRLKVISRMGSGTENIDLEAARELGIDVMTTPAPHASAVAELALGGIIATLRHLGAADRDLRNGIWRKPMGRLLSGKTVGIVGTGRVGRALVELIAPFRCRLLAVDTTPDLEWAQSVGVEYRELDRILEAADIVSLHVPLSPATRQLLDRRRLGLLKHGAVLVNCARGGLVDEAALAENLHNGQLGGAYLDVFEAEPYSGALIEAPNTLLSPHLGSYAAEARLEMELEAARNLVQGLSREAGGA